jgi:Xaa-Pro aminopeptidase
VIGEATPEQHRIWSVMQETLAAIYEHIRPGVSTRELWDVFVRRFADHDMEPSIRFLGHGLGPSLHEEPFIAAHTDTVLEAGMVFAIEPVFRTGKVGYHLEDNVIVTSDGYENITNVFGRELIVLG